MIDSTIKQSLEKVLPGRFLRLSVEDDSELLTFIESKMDPHQQKLIFHRGNTFYEFTHESEDISAKKEVVLMDVVRSYINTMSCIIAN